ncbi:unnamed protein product [Caenorhabditis brenneri]
MWKKWKKKRHSRAVKRRFWMTMRAMDMVRFFFSICCLNSSILIFFSFQILEKDPTTQTC